MQKIIIATHNEGKAREFRSLFEALNVDVQSLKDLNYYEEIEETGSTFNENAKIKAEAIAAHYNEIVIADDSGLTIEALDGKPGVYSARYAGEQKNDQENIKKVLSKMEGVANAKRKAQFVCVLAVAVPGKPTYTIKGTCDGVITHTPSGENGFGYDPIFYVPSLLKTLAQMSQEEKNQISHRADALKELKARWDEIF
ncbi:XTP/dITP diphosphatase [Pseudalkalibacillus decolorationis]|uniref:XTP/dITP diphosphatase n=1 Tax=Pseudalkalibacillus decolorationis TaxID=163879 RepID=UPI0021486E50|nr:XTP/dITP diphosphatase [Pseudalkalibacillus decolorationis]